MLTDEEIKKLGEGNQGTWQDDLQFARAVIAAYEAKLLEQNEPVGYRYLAYDGSWSFNRMNVGDVSTPVFEHPAPIPSDPYPVPDHCESVLWRTWRINLDALAPIPEVEAKYNELLMAVAQKFPNETRHETALRYIMDREHRTEFKPKAARSGE